MYTFLLSKNLLYSEKVTRALQYNYNCPHILVILVQVAKVVSTKQKLNSQYMKALAFRFILYTV